MKIVKTILLGLLAIPLVLLAAVVVVQTYYHLTPVALSTEALELNARAEKLPTLTERLSSVRPVRAARTGSSGVWQVLA